MHDSTLSEPGKPQRAGSRPGAPITRPRPLPVSGNPRGARGRFATWIFGLGLALYILVSAPLLTVFGIPYDAPSGNFLFKLHPATYLVGLAFFIASCRRGNPLGSILRLAIAQRGMTVYLIAICCVLSYSVVRYGPSGSAFIIETFVMPGVCVLMMQMLDDRSQCRFFYLIIGLVVLNALIGLAESIAQTRLVSYTVAGGIELKEDVFRSTALLGHPLTNALITGPLLVAVLALRLKPVFRLTVVGVLLLGLLSFGGRTSFLATLLLVTLYLGALALGRLLRGGYGYLQIIGGLITPFFIIAILIGAVLATGVGERIFTHLVWDNSASVRLHIWDVFDFLRVDDVVFGLSPTDISRLAYRLKMGKNVETIENFWLVMLLQLGVVAFLPFVFGMFSAIRFIWQRSAMPARLSIILFLVVASSNNSLSVKTCTLTVLFTAWIGAAAHSRLSGAHASGIKRRAPAGRAPP